MAPGLIEPSSQFAEAQSVDNKATLKLKAPISYIPGRHSVEVHDETYKYEDLRPSFPDLKWPPLEETPYHDKGLLGDPEFKNLLSSATDVFDYNPKIGTEVHGVDLANLTDAQKNDLARLIATRGVVFFRNQKNFDIDAQRELGQYFGKLHSHATTACPRRPGLEDVHVVWSGEGSPDLRALFSPTFLWHSDVSSASSLSVFKVLTSSGDIRSAASILHISQSPDWPTSRRRR
jgi:sulfonate dioxygenase